MAFAGRPGIVAPDNGGHLAPSMRSTDQHRRARWREFGSARRVMGFVGVIAVLISAVAVGVGSAHHEHHHDRAGERDQNQQDRRGGGAESECGDGSGDQSRRVPHHVLGFHRWIPCSRFGAVVDVNTASEAGYVSSTLVARRPKPLWLLIVILAAALRQPVWWKHGWVSLTTCWETGICGDAKDLKATARPVNS